MTERPELCCVYRFFATSGELLYVGITTTPLDRHFEHRKDKEWYRSIDSMSFDWYPSRQAALMAERIAIKTENPRWNIAQRAGTGDAAAWRRLAAEMPKRTTARALAERAKLLEVYRLQCEIEAITVERDQLQASLAVASENLRLTIQKDHSLAIQYAVQRATVGEKISLRNRQRSAARQAVLMRALVQHLRGKEAFDALCDRVHSFWPVVWLTRSQMSEILGVSETEIRTVERSRGDQELPLVQIHRMTRYVRAKVVPWVDAVLCASGMVEHVDEATVADVPRTADRAVLV